MPNPVNIKLNLINQLYWSSLNITSVILVKTQTAKLTKGKLS